MKLVQKFDTTFFFETVKQIHITANKTKMQIQLYTLKSIIVN